MKNKLIAGLVLSMFLPVVGNAAPINWLSEQYRLYAQLEIDVNGTPQVLESKYNLSDLPFVRNASTSSANGSASTSISIKNLSDSNASIFELTNNIATSYTGGNNPANQFSSAISGADFDNSFIANSTNLYVTYDYSSLINMANSTPSLAYQGVTTRVILQDKVNSLLDQTVSFVDDYVDNSGTQGPHNATTAGINYSLIGNGTHIFTGLIIGRTYSLYTDISPDMFSSGTIADSSSKSILRVGFSDSAVPEPETNAMLLTGLAFFGFSVRRKKQA